MRLGNPSPKRIVLAIVVVVAVLAVATGGFWYVHRLSQNGTTAATVPTNGAAVASSSMASPAVGFIYENDDFTGADPYNHAKFVLYDLTHQTSTVLKDFDADFAAPSGTWRWHAMDGNPLILSTDHSNDNELSFVTFFDPSSGFQTSTRVSHSDLVSFGTDLVISTRDEKVSYCDQDGAFTVFDVASGRSRQYLNAHVCYTDFSAGQPFFSRDGKSLIYWEVPFTDEGGESADAPIPERLDLQSGAVSTTTYLEADNLGRLSPDGTKYILVSYAGFSIRDVAGKIEDPAYMSDNDLASLKTLYDITLPSSTSVGAAVFATDGNGVFYYTDMTDPVTNEFGDFALGYYDILTKTNHYPMPLPSGQATGINLLGATDKEHLIYSLIKEYFSGGWEPGHVTDVSGSSTLYLQGLDTPAVPIDNSVAGVSLKGFVISN